MTRPQFSQIDYLVWSIFMFAVITCPLHWVPESVSASRVGLILLTVGLILSLLLRIQVYRLTSGVTILYASSVFLQFPFMVSILFTSEPELGINMLVRDAFYAAFSWLLCIYLKDIAIDRMFKHVGLAMQAGFWLFLAVSSVHLTLLGVDLISIYANAISTANPYLVQYEVFDTLLRSMVESEEHKASAGRHTICLFACMAAAFFAVWPQGNFARSITTCFAVFVPILVSVVSMSRQATVVAMVVVGMYVYFQRSVVAWVAVNAIAVLFCCLIIFGPVRDLANEKLVDDVVENPRVEQFRDALLELSGTAYRGVGAGVPIESTTRLPYFAHNLVLHHFHQAGIPGLLASLFYMLALLGNVGWLLGMSLRTSSVERKRYAALAITLYSLPLVRAMVGVCGELDYSSSMAFGIATSITHQLGRDSSIT